MTQINLLPWREQIKQERLIVFIFHLGIGIFIIITSVIIINLFLFGLIKHQENRNAYLSSQLGEENSRLITLNNQMKDLDAIDNNLELILSLKESSYQAVRQLDELAKIIPDTVSLKKITREGSRITLTGNAKSNLQITLLMKNIAASTIFIRPNLTEINIEEKNTTDDKEFILSMDTRSQVKQ